MDGILQIQASTGISGTRINEPTEHFTKQMVQKHQEDQEKVRAVVAELNKFMDSSNTKLSFTVDRAMKKTIIKVVDEQTNEVIRQIPSDEALKIAQHIKNLIGILCDASA
jgi:uncharacterized FlaG/YvyC family protein